MVVTENTRRVLIISSHPIFAKALAHMAVDAGCDVIASVSDVQQALPILESNDRVTVIVDYADAQPHEAEWLPLLQSQRDASQSTRNAAQSQRNAAQSRRDAAQSHGNARRSRGPALQGQKDLPRRIILLTLANDEMIVHEQRRVPHATATEFKYALGM